MTDLTARITTLTADLVRLDSRSFISNLPVADRIEAELAGDMLYIVNEDAPGFIGRIGTLLGENGINIGTFHLGRRDAGGEAVLLLSLDAPIPQNVMDAARKLPGVKTVRALAF